MHQGFIHRIIIQYFRWMDKFFEEHLEYQIMHSHIDSMSYLPLLAAKRANVPVRIAHSHNTSIDRDLKYPLKAVIPDTDYQSSE